MKRKGYTKVPNALFTDHNLTVGARFVCAYLMSNKADWEYTAEGIAGAVGMGLDWAKDMLKELERAGILKRERVRDEKGRLRGTSYSLSYVGNTYVGETNVGTTYVGKTPPIRIIYNKKNKEKKTKCEPHAASGGTHTPLELFRMNLTKAAEGKRVPAAILRKFEAYWTQEAKGGKQLWQVTRPFDFGKRLNKWLEDERAI